MLLKSRPSIPSSSFRFTEMSALALRLPADSLIAAFLRLFIGAIKLRLNTKLKIREATIAMTIFIQLGISLKRIISGG